MKQRNLLQKYSRKAGKEDTKVMWKKIMKPVISSLLIAVMAAGCGKTGEDAAGPPEEDEVILTWAVFETDNYKIGRAHV